MDYLRLRNDLGMISVMDEDSGSEDNIAIALATYFEKRLDCPDGDVDEETGWSRWAVEKTNETMDRIVMFMNREYLRRTHGIITEGTD